MKWTSLIVAALLSSFGFGFYLNQERNSTESNESKSEIKIKEPMKLGAFSMSLSVKDLSVSRSFYENMGFTVFGGSMESNYLIMKNGNCLIGLFQGMFEGNILTFNPGWNENAENIEEFDDIRKIQEKLKGEGVEFLSEADEKTEGPASFMITDPDGNTILFDQHR